MIVKVCGVRTAEVADAAAAAGADLVGVVLEPRSPRHADADAVEAVREAVAGRAQLVAVMMAPALDDAVALVGRHRLDALQLHGEVGRDWLARSPVPVIRAINVATVGDAAGLDWPVDCLVLLDSAAARGELPGGTGRRLDTGVAATVAAHREVILAGGLDASSVAAAVAAVRPRGVDASSGLESAPGVKDPARVADYVGAARAAAAALAAG